MAGTLAGRLAGIVLGVVLLVAGIAKRGDRSWAADAGTLGAPAWTLAPLPWVEICLGALLISGLVRPLVATIAGLLLLVFTVLLVGNLVRGRHPPCACFGARSRRPVSAVSVVRNAGLIGLAAVAVIA